MFNIVLFEPEIPPNTGNIIRLAANTGCQLHLIKPYGFALDDKKLRRAGLDYREFTSIRQYDSYHHFIQHNKPQNIYALSTKGTAHYHELTYQAGDYFLFVPETRGLTDDVLSSLPTDSIVRIPMQPQSRSLNLSNAVAIMTYEALRQNCFTFEAS